MAWGWLVVYVTFPIAFAAALVAQARVGGPDLPRTSALPRAVQVFLWVQAGALSVFGVALFLFPGSVASWWPWTLTALTARVLGAWLLGLAAMAGHASYENDWGRIANFVAGASLFAALEAIVLIRYRRAVDWSKPVAFALVAMVTSFAVLAVAGTAARRRSEA
jgi:hypothetical protein